jgi:hypothetical protein
MASDAFQDAMGLRTSAGAADQRIPTASTLKAFGRATKQFVASAQRNGISRRRAS